MLKEALIKMTALVRAVCGSGEPDLEVAQIERPTLCSVSYRPGINTCWTAAGVTAAQWTATTTVSKTVPAALCYGGLSYSDSKIPRQTNFV
jgi:hypothetical protein